ncbi:MAG TPA: DNA adenine methylase, partial [Nitrososphaeraceae archaeon]|nr:DNA adenine methylase [Nitrososphaeraceae archaeon]
MDICDNMSLKVKPFAKNISETCHPFVKWAGGKSRLISQIKKFIPNEFNNYFEPFVGSGALFFYITRSFKIKRDCYAHLSDINSELINGYKIIKDNLTDLIKELQYNEIEYN